MYFGNRRPRGFHHTFRFSNERRDILDALKRGVAPEDVARQSLEGSSDGDRKSARQPARITGWLFIVALLLLLAALMARVFKIRNFFCTIFDPINVITH